MGSNLGTLYSDEDVSYLAGWLGDAAIPETNGTTSIANDDYCADLDAENTYRLILQGHSSVDAFSEYYCSLLNSTNRAKIFLGYITYTTVRNKVFYQLIDKDLIIIRELAIQQERWGDARFYNDLLNDESYHWDTIRNSYPDTYNFLKSLDAKLETMGDFIS